MSIESEILRIQHNIANAYASVSERGGTVPLQPTSEKLAAAVTSIPAGESDGEVYSTEEQKIGTWIDGKPLYRKTWVTRTPTATDSSQELLSIENLHVDTAVTVKGIINEGSGISQYVQCPYYYDSSYFCYLICCGENNDWAANTLRCKVGAECSLKSIFVTLEYTKTTDTATTSAVSAEEVP